jgi:hexosaminidase
MSTDETEASPLYPCRHPCHGSSTFVVTTVIESFRRSSRTAAAGVVLLLAAACARTPATTTPTPAKPVVPVSYAPRLVPQPTSLTPAGDTSFVITEQTVLEADGADAMPVATLFAARIRPATGYALVPAAPAVPTNSIRFQLRPDRADLGDEGYELVVRPDSVRVIAHGGAGLFHGAQTLRQLLPPEIESDIRVGRPWGIPSLTIRDVPRFAWRGAMLDVARHFFTVNEVKQYIDILAMYKMNVLHLHLADDQGWRIEIKSRPLLAEKGSVTEVAGRPGGGGYFTQEQYADIVRYAQERYVTVVPEIDMPSHINAALIAYPELACGRRAPGPYTGIDVGWSTICVDSAQSYALLEDVIREISAITPGPWFHLGGDEVQTLTPEQYTSFVQRVQDIVMRNGKAAVGWEEIAAAQLEPGTIVQLWRADSLKHALGPGVKILLSPAKKAYIDQKYDPTTELGLRWAGYVDVRDSYDWNPGTYLHNVGEDRIAGVEAPIWTETLRCRVSRRPSPPRHRRGGLERPGLPRVGGLPPAPRRAGSSLAHARHQLLPLVADSLVARRGGAPPGLTAARRWR